MKKKIKKNNDGRAKISYTYALNDGVTMKEAPIKKRKIKFNQLYINTIKHEEDIRRWIESGKRKKGDIRRSLEGLDNKFQELFELKEDYDRKGIFEIKKFKSDDDESYDLEDLNNRIINLYSLAGETRESTYYQNDKEVAPKSIKTKILELFPLTKKKTNEEKEDKKYSFDYRKIGRRIAAFAMAMSMAIFAGAKANNTKMQTEDKDAKSYTDIDNRKNDKNNFKESLYIEAAREVENETNNDGEKKNSVLKNNTQNQTKSAEILEEDANEYLAIEGTKYSEVSDGSGNIGYFSKDTEVKVYNRALVKTDKNGNKQILEVSKVGQTWKEYAEEKGLDYDEFKEYMNNNKNIKKYVSLDSIDGTKSYGWVLEDTLEKIGEVER